MLLATLLTWCCLLASPAAAEESTNASAAWQTVDSTAASTDPVASAAQQPPVPATASLAQRTGWQFSAGPYLWMAGLKGHMGVSPEVEPAAVDMSFGDILSSLKFAAMGTFDARHGRFVASADLLYLKMGGSKGVEARGVDFIDAELESGTFITTMTAGYRAVDEDRQSLDLLGGGRVYSMETSLDLTGPNRAFSESKTETWIDPVIGLRFLAPIGQRVSLLAYGDVGGFGVASHLTWQLRGEIHYRVSNRWSLTGGWRHLDIDYHRNGFVFNAAMDGPILGAIYRF